MSVITSVSNRNNTERGRMTVPRKLIRRLDSTGVSEQRGFIEYGECGHVCDLVGHAGWRPAFWEEVVV